MNETSPPLPRNPETHRAHKRDVFWQITFPLIVGLLFVLLLAGLTLVAATGGGSVGQAADASLIFLIIPLMLVTVIFTLIFGALAYGMMKFNGILPLYTRRAQDAFEQIRQQARSGSDKAAAPFLKLHGLLASLRALRRK